jgi:hypothetical protein
MAQNSTDLYPPQPGIFYNKKIEGEVQHALSTKANNSALQKRIEELEEENKKLQENITQQRNGFEEKKRALQAELKQMKNNQIEKLKNEGKLIDYQYTKDGKTYHVEGSITEKKETNTSSMSEDEKKELVTKEAANKEKKNKEKKVNQFMFEVEIQHKTYIVDVTVTELKKNTKANDSKKSGKKVGGRRKRLLRVTRKKQ